MMDRCSLGTKTSWITIAINTGLCLFKILAGMLGRSSAMLADGVHTLSDILATFVVIFGLRLSSKDADVEHPYGHEKFEPVCAKVISFILFSTGIFIGYEGIRKLLSGTAAMPGKIALVAAAVSIIVKELMYWYTIIVAKKIGSISMEADAWHHRSDAFSSIGTLAGIFGARMGFTALDPIAGIVVSFFIIKIGIEYYIKATRQLVDLAAGQEVIDSISSLTLSVAGVQDINQIKTRIFGSKLYVDMEIRVDGDMTVREGHEIAECVHDKVEGGIENVKHCMIHVEPYKKGNIS